MIPKPRVSRWVAYVGVFAAGGALLAGNPLSALVGALLIGQYAALEFYRGYSS